ncbi:hypothetical protein ACE193_20625 [Bernardetia sp. OM2101]|uniref:hypothetical protein n=1 Tax=Bernardetia sp. OM2101 TaxID=3344876 RepID=UPI0035D00220
MFKIKSRVYLKACFVILSIFMFGCASNNQTNNQKTLKKEGAFDYGEVKNGKYTNSYFGLQIDIPKDWAVQSKEQIELVRNLGKEVVAGDNEMMKAIIKASEVNSATLLQVFQYELGTPVDYNSNFTIVVENVKLFPAIKTGEDYLKNVSKLLRQSQVKYNHIDEEFEKVTFSGQEFYLMNTNVEYADKSIRQKYYSTILKGFSVGIVASYITPEQEKELDNVMESLKFKN